MFVNSFLLLQLQYGTLLAMRFPDTVGVQSLETVDLLNYLPQICMQENGKSFGRPNLHSDNGTLCCMQECRNVCTSLTEQLTKDRRQSLWLHLEYKL